MTHNLLASEQVVILIANIYLMNIYSVSGIVLTHLILITTQTYWHKEVKQLN